MKAIKFIITLGTVAFFLLIVAGGFVVIVSGGDPVDWARTEWIRLQLAGRQEELATPAGDDPTEYPITIESGNTPRIVAGNLAAQNLITDAELFVDYLRVAGLDRQLETGTYFVAQTQTIPQIADLIVDVSNSAIVFRVLPGTRMEEIAAAIDATPRFAFTGSDFLAVVGTGATINPALSERYGIPTGASLEGFLYPDTYRLPPNVTPLQLRDLMLMRFQQVVGDAVLITAREQDLTMRDVVTLASIVEREALYDDEMPAIAAVYRNRLDIGMKLDADPTVQYGLGNSRGRWWAQITQADYQGVNSPYNTYRNQGLPPGPIANPSLAAIDAVLNPDTSDYFYFRVRCDGSGYHHFSETYEEHLSYVC